MSVSQRLYAGQLERSWPRAWIALLLSSGPDSTAQYFKGLGGSKGEVWVDVHVCQRKGNSLEINSTFN